MGAMTVGKIEAAKAIGKLYFLSDGRGLFLRIGPDGSKTRLVRVSINGKQRDKSLGKAWGCTMTDGRLSLEDARAAAATMRSHARDGVDYLEAKKRERELMPAACGMALIVEFTGDDTKERGRERRRFRAPLV
ncbi:Arm DNA-binding domain-containing protein [Burkholderia sp. Ac-20349]|uniref:Arm DNA-binding domain-containing protein n=1 Tax=Burkholderia sp. Ac-20349 TaxID=2703893 RepID=UPI0004D45CF4|nr:Arm DNA-binding domain-containing protein [Burkholderia sp. Ac-20349]KER68998.1 hypothetical protein HR51_25665 [Burkholderia cepacia]MBN3838389.1 DUF4102 domain-containing protein [Burkholderia sp. Ac-20349]